MADRTMSTSPPPTSVMSGASEYHWTAGPMNGGAAWASTRSAVPVARRDGRLHVVGLVLHVRDQAVDAGLDAIEHGLRVDADEHDHHDERRQDQPLLPVQLGEVAVLLAGLTVEHALVGPQQV